MPLDYYVFIVNLTPVEHVVQYAIGTLISTAFLAYSYSNVSRKSRAE